MRVINYDRDLYKTLIETARLVPIPEHSLKSFPPRKLENLVDKKVGEQLIFTCKNSFFEEDIFNIIRVHLPIEANTYLHNSENRTLTIQFYKL